jgi:hypothetical protein
LLCNIEASAESNSPRELARRLLHSMRKSIDYGYRLRAALPVSGA